MLTEDNPKTDIKSIRNCPEEVIVAEMRRFVTYHTVAMVFSALLVLANLIVDLLYSYFDPRINLS